MARYACRTANRHSEKAVEPLTALAAAPIDINAADLYMTDQKSVDPEGQMIEIMCAQYCSGPGWHKLLHGKRAGFSQGPNLAATLKRVGKPTINQPFKNCLVRSDPCADIR